VARECHFCDEFPHCSLLKNLKFIINTLPYDIADKTKNRDVLIQKIFERVEEVCKGQVSPGYVLDASHTCDYIFYVLDSLDELIGFSLVKVLYGALYIDVICASGVGKKIIDKVEEMAIHMKNGTSYCVP